MGAGPEGSDRARHELRHPTYTPIEWDEIAGSTGILGYMDRDAPGSAWVRRPAVGDEYDMLGPRNSLDASEVSSPLAVFGDETSLGLAYALQSSVPGRTTTCRFEVRNVADAEPVLQACNIKASLTMRFMKGIARPA